jgi:Domain of unknown function (DUF4340)
MRGPLAKTLVALLVCAGLGYFAWQEFQKEGPDDKDKKAKVLAFDKAKANSIRFERLGGEKITLVKQGDFWRLSVPFDVPASTTEVEALLAGFEGLEIQDTVTDKPEALQPFGLDPPKTTASVTFEGGASVSVALGDPTPDASAVYALRPGETKLFTIATFQAGALDKKPFDLRDRDLLHVARDNVRTLDVSGPEGPFSLARDERGEWRIVRPACVLTGRWSVDSLLGLLEALRMESVAAESADNLKPFGLDPPARGVTIGLADGSTRRLEIGSATPDKKYHAREAQSRLVAVIAGALIDDLAKGVGELRSKRLLDVSTYDVEALEGKSGGKDFKYARSGEKDKDGVETFKWKRTAPDAKDVDTTKIEEALFKLTGLEALQFVDAPAALATYGLDAPELTLTLRLAAGKPEQSLSVGRKDGKVWARRAGDEALLELDAAKFDQALKELNAL